MEKYVHQKLSIVAVVCSFFNVSPTCASDLELREYSEVKNKTPTLQPYAFKYPTLEWLQEKAEASLVTLREKKPSAFWEASFSYEGLNLTLHTIESNVTDLQNFVTYGGRLDIVGFSSHAHNVSLSYIIYKNDAKISPRPNLPQCDHLFVDIDLPSNEYGRWRFKGDDDPFAGSKVVQMKKNDTMPLPEIEAMPSRKNSPRGIFPKKKFPRQEVLIPINSTANQQMATASTHKNSEEELKSIEAALSNLSINSDASNYAPLKTATHYDVSPGSKDKKDILTQAQ